MEQTNQQPPAVIHTDVTVEAPGQSFFLNAQSFDHAQRVAKMLCASDLVPEIFRGPTKIGNCVIALNMASRIGADPLMVMQNLYVVHGKPAWSSSFLIATINASGRFSPLRYEEDNENGGRCRAVATDLATGEKCEGIWVTMEMATAEGWIEKKGSKWKTMPQLMRRYRAATFFCRQFAPEISMGLQTHEETQDVYAETVPNNEQQPENTDAVQKAKDDLKRVTHNTKVREEIAKLEKQMEGLALDDEKYLTLQRDIEELEKQIQK